MDIQLVQANSNSNTSSSFNGKDDQIIINDSQRPSRRIGDDDSTLHVLIKNDRGLVIFLMVLGFYIHNDRNSTVVKIAARMWQFILLLFGGIGLCWTVFIYGGHSIANLCELLTSNSKSIGVFIEFGLVLENFIVPLVQVGSLIYGITNVYKQIDQPVSADIVSPLLALCKRNALIYFVCMALLVIIINPISMTRNYYDTEYADYLDDGTLTEYGNQSYSLFLFNRFTGYLFLNLSVACYLSVMMLFTSLTMMQINTIQEDVLKIVSATSPFDLDKYLEGKKKIITLKNRSYFSTQLLTFTAAINAISFMFALWYIHFSFIKRSNGSNDDRYIIHLTDYSDMLFISFNQCPYLLKEVVFFFYILYRTSVINTLHDKIVETANDKYWDVSQRCNNNSSSSNSNSDVKQLCDYAKIETETYSIFKLGPIVVKRRRVIATMVGFLLYCLYLLVMVQTHE